MVSSQARYYQSRGTVIIRGLGPNADTGKPETDLKLVLFGGLRCYRGVTDIPIMSTVLLGTSPTTVI